MTPPILYHIIIQKLLEHLTFVRYTKVYLSTSIHVRVKSLFKVMKKKYMSSYVIFSYSSYPLALKFVTINSLIKLNVSFFNIILNKDYSKTKEFPREKT